MKIPKHILNQIESGDINILPVMNIEGSSHLDEIDLPQTLPILALRNAVLFPGTILPITIGREQSLKLVKALYKSSKIIGAVTQLDAREENPKKEDLYDIGTSARILKLIEMPDGSLTAILQGLKRLHLNDIIATDPYILGTVTYLDDIQPAKNDDDMDAIAASIKDTSLYILKLSPHLPQEVGFAIKNIESYDMLTNVVASGMDSENPCDKMELLVKDNIKDRAYKLLEVLNKQIEILKIRDDIQQKVKNEIDQQQREYYLNNQLKTIQEELGMDGNSQDIKELKQKALLKKWPKHVAQIFDKEIQRLAKTNPNSPEYGIQMNYLDFIVDLPWDVLTEDNLDLKHARKVLDKDHFGLDTVKERIIEYLAVLKLKGDMKSPIICLYGPPGVGKTSLGKSIAKTLGRKYGRISLGGLHDESEIRGHRKTYIGAMEGRIIQTIKKAGSSNPVIVLDEIDKVSSDYKGDPASALLEVLDPEQNTAFHDN
ncbi:MAG: LON peptidase substrate-binding domain-containing protein, partial [Bacteroidales bacterium]